MGVEDHLFMLYFFLFPLFCICLFFCVIRFVPEPQLQRACHDGIVNGRIAVSFT